MNVCKAITTLIYNTGKGGNKSDPTELASVKTHRTRAIVMQPKQQRACERSKSVK